MSDTDQAELRVETVDGVPCVWQDHTWIPVAKYIEQRTAALRAENGQFRAAIQAAAESRVELEARERALRAYVSHHPACNAQRFGDACSCGLDAALAAAPAAEVVQRYQDPLDHTHCYVNPDGTHVRGCDAHGGQHPYDWCRPRRTTDEPVIVQGDKIVLRDGRRVTLEELDAALGEDA